MIAGTMADPVAGAATDPKAGAPAAAAAPAPVATPPAAAATTALTGAAAPAAPAAGAPAATQPAAAAAPAEIVYALKGPEGTDAKLVEGTVEFAKQHKLSPEAAQAVLDREIGVRKSLADAHQESLAKLPAQWLEQAKADAEIGGAKLDENLGHAKRALARFGSPGLTQALNDSGLGNHPELIRLLAKAGRAMREDPSVATRNEPGRELDAEARAARMFPSTVKSTP